MKKPSKTITAIALAATLLATTVGHGQQADQEHSEPEKIPLSYVHFSANNSSATASTSFVVVQNSITDVEHDATPQAKPNSTQGN